MKKIDPRRLQKKWYELKEMLTTFAALLSVLFGDFYPLYDQILKLWTVLNHPSIKAVKSKFTRVRCSHITWQVLEETRLFFDQQLVPNDLTNRGPRRFPTADLGGLIKDVRRNKLLDPVTMKRQWNNQENLNTWATHHGKIQGGNVQPNGVFRYSPKVNKFRPLFNISKKGNGNFIRGGMLWQAQNPEHRHLVIIKFMAKFVQKYSTPYFTKVLIAGKKTVNDLPKYGGKLHGKRDMCMNQILEKCKKKIARSIMHTQNNWMRNMQQMYAPLLHRVWTTFGGMVQQTLRCQFQ